MLNAYLWFRRAVNFLNKVSGELCVSRVLVLALDTWKWLCGETVIDALVFMLHGEVCVCVWEEWY